jgi:hypothetical protein
MTLHELLEAAARAGREAQQPDGSFAPGRNGPYGDRETPVRTTGHWLVELLAAWQRTGEAGFCAAAEAALGWLLADKARPEGASFWHRVGPSKDRCNGLVGQAWTLEALAAAADTLHSLEAAELAERVFLLHPFDERVGLWRRVEIDGRDLGFDPTLNHQLWFAAAGALLAPSAGAEVGRRVARFLACLPRNLALRRDGLVRHWVAPWGLARRSRREALRHWIMSAREAPVLAGKEVGYHAFNLYALALLRLHLPDAGFWRSTAFARLWQAARGPAFRAAVDTNIHGWPYNPTGIEMAFALEVFEGRASRAEQSAWLSEQIARHWDPRARAMRRGTPDPETLAARLYEATRLSDLPVPVQAVSRGAAAAFGDRR